MSGSLARAAPVRFLIGVAAVWTMGRGVAVFGWAPPSLAPPIANPNRILPTLAIPPLLAARPTQSLLRPDMLRGTFGSASSPSPSIAPGQVRRLPPERPRLPADEAYRATRLLMLAAYSGSPIRVYPRSGGLIEAAIALGQPLDRRWSGSAWAFLRGGGRATMLSPGQVGGGQAGARVLYRINRHLSAAARISTAIGGLRQTEAAAGFDWKPDEALPVHLMAERRIAIDRGGRNAWTLGAAGGVYDVRIATGWRLDAYGEAGVVGARRRDLYADGAARIARAIDLGGGASLAFGGGVWGAAQPGASRLDIGPSVVLRLPVEHRTVAIALDWRQRALGHARPGSGAALTIATDF
ncbi:hypothetical protein [Sphingomonas oryzagri]